MPRLSHMDAQGRIEMVDVTGKPATARRAVAQAEVRLNAPARRALDPRRNAKGDCVATARLAGILAAKRTSELLPLCHPLPLSHISIDVQPTPWGVRVIATVASQGRTGVEMEALTAASIAALTLYDMLKAVDKSIVIGALQLETKDGGKSGPYRRAKRHPQ